MQTDSKAPTSTIQNLRNNSERILSDVRTSVSDLCSSYNASIVAFGSIARGEFSSESDLDYSILVDAEDGAEEISAIHDCIREFCGTRGIRLPSQGGAFGSRITIESLYKTIGGKDDTNENLTRRLLTLLESTSLDNGNQVEGVRRQILERYVERLSPNNVARFLLNDIIRYYRTICVDFEYKTRGGKSWGDRRIKLAYSRKLIYISGIIAVLSTKGKAREGVVDQLLSYFAMTPLDRIHGFLGSEHVVRIFDHYDFFLSEMAKRETRQELTRLNSPDVARKSPIFTALKKRSEQFNREILNALIGKYSYDELELILL